MTTDRGAGGNEMNDIVDRLRGQEPLHLGDRSAAADVIERLRDELAECKHDAERYRWLKPRVSGRDYRNMGVIYGDGGEGIDEAIDAALAADGNAPATPA